MNICCNCSSSNKVDKFVSKLKGTSSLEFKYLCDDCFKEVDEEELKFITSSFKKGMNITELVDIKYIKDFSNPNSPYCIFKPIQSYSIIEDEETKKKYVKIDFDEYIRFIHLLMISNTKLHTDEWVNKKQLQQEKHNAVEVRKILKLERDEKTFNEKLQKKEERIKQQVREQEYEREREEKRLEEHKEDNKKLYKDNKDFKPQKCEFCNNYKVFPLDFKNNKGKITLLSYRKQGKYQKGLSCSDCYLAQKQKDERKRDDRNEKYAEYCDICECSFIACNDFELDNHYASKKHKRNENKLKGIVDFTLLTIKELQKICSKSLNDDGTYIISNYTRLKKNDLIEKMNTVKDQLVFT